MSANNTEFLKKVINITQIDSPHKFWYKDCNDLEKDHALRQLEAELETYTIELFTRDGNLPELRDGDVVAANYAKWGKWIRGKSGRIKYAQKDGEVDTIHIWAIDYGFQFRLPLNQVVPIIDMRLAYRRPINVHIGGLSNIVPATMEFNEEAFDMEIVKRNSWSKKATELFNEWIADQTPLTFLVECVESSRFFGQVLIHSQNGNEPFSVSTALCSQNEAMFDENYLNDVKILNKDDFLRLNHEITQPRAEEAIDEMAEYIWMNDDDPMSFEDRQIEIGTEAIPEEPAQNRQHSQSGTHGHSALTGHSMSTVSMTLSVKSLNKWNLMKITHAIVDRTNQWKDTFYFKDKVRDCMKRLYRDRIDPMCAWGWPHIMRGNSLLMIGERERNTMQILPTICSTVWRASEDWLTPVRIEPIGIIFVSGSEKVEPMATICRKLLIKTNMNDLVNVFCLNSSFEIDQLVRVSHVDILVMPIFCFPMLVKKMPKLFTSKRLGFVWFDGINKMCHVNEFNTLQAMEVLAAQDLDLQVQVTTEMYHPVLKELFDRIRTQPMLLIGDGTPFEAALCAGCFFVTEFLAPESKIIDLIEKLLDTHSKMTGSIVIVCNSLAEVKFVTGSLTQSNIKCIDFDDLYSKNQLKLVSWTEQSLNFDSSIEHRNILVCEDKNLDQLPIRTATHIVHYSLPNQLQTFLYRFLTCFGFYNEKLEREWLQKPDQFELARPISLTYFDENFCDEFIQIYDVMANRTQCEMPVELTDAVEILKEQLEERKFEIPLCIQLITKAKTCDISCPYRHIHTVDNETAIPEYGFVNMDLIEVLAPNHFSVRVFGHKRRLEHKSKRVEYLEVEGKQFERKLREYYSLEGMTLQPEQIKTGELYLYFQQPTRPKRCHVVSQSRSGIQIYLIDDGKIRHCKEHELYVLDEEFREFPARAIEIFVLGYKPNDNNTKWLPEAKQYVERMMVSLKEGDHDDSYLQAEVIRSFDRRLIVKDLKILYKVQGKLQGKFIAQNLIKSRLADKAKIVLHDIFMETPNTSQNGSADLPSNTTWPESTVTLNHFYRKDLVHNELAQSEYSIQASNPTHGTVVQNNLMQSTPFASDDNWDNLYSGSNTSASLFASGLPMAVNRINRTTMNIPPAPANSTVSSIQAPKDSSDAFFENALNQSSRSIMNNTQSTVNVSVPSVDEIFGSLPEEIQAVEVLSPTKLESMKQIDETDGKQEEEENQGNWLIQFSDSDDDNEEDNSNEPSPFEYVRLINSYNDL